MAKLSPDIVPSKEQMSEAPSIIKGAGLRHVFPRIVAICGKITRILCSAAWRFNKLKAFLASTKITESPSDTHQSHHLLGCHATGINSSLIFF